MTKATSKRTRKQAKKAFAKLPHSTRPFTAQDYAALPNDPDRKPTVATLISIGGHYNGKVGSNSKEL